MKILVLLFLVFASTLGATEVHAARGVVPSIAPLFPTPENTKPNLGRNVNYEGESVFSEPAAELAEGAVSENEATSTKTDGVAGATEQQVQTYWWWIIGVLVAVGIVGAFGYWWFHMQKRV